ncbi:MAG: MarR family winged helix-turn-helix transcriptional regulator [Planctomycetota bacterium]
MYETFSIAIISVQMIGPRMVEPNEERALGVGEISRDRPQIGPGPAEPVSRKRFDLRVVQALRRIIRAVDLHSRKLSALHQITGPQLVCLLTIDEFAPITLSALAREVHLSPSTVLGIIDRLEVKGLVRRERDLKDRRLLQISLTGPGRDLIANAPSPLQDTLAHAMSELPADQQATIAQSLERIVELMEVRDIDAAPILETGPIAKSPNASEETVS